MLVHVLQEDKCMRLSTIMKVIHPFPCIDLTTVPVKDLHVMPDKLQALNSSYWWIGYLWEQNFVGINFLFDHENLYLAKFPTYTVCSPYATEIE